MSDDKFINRKHRIFAPVSSISILRSVRYALNTLSVAFSASNARALFLHSTYFSCSLCVSAREAVFGFDQWLSVSDNPLENDGGSRSGSRNSSRSRRRFGE